MLDSIRGGFGNWGLKLLEKSDLNLIFVIIIWLLYTYYGYYLLKNLLKKLDLSNNLNYFPFHISKRKDWCLIGLKPLFMKLYFLYGNYVERQSTAFKAF